MLSSGRAKSSGKQRVLETEDDVNSPFNLVHQTIRQHTDLSPKGFIGYGDDLPQEEIAFPHKPAQASSNAQSEDARVLDEACCRGDKNSRWIPGLVNSLGGGPAPLPNLPRACAGEARARTKPASSYLGGIPSGFFQ